MQIKKTFFTRKSGKSQETRAKIAAIHFYSILEMHSCLYLICGIIFQSVLTGLA